MKLNTAEARESSPLIFWFQKVALLSMQLAPANIQLLDPSNILC